MSPREQLVRAALRVLEGTAGAPCLCTVTIQAEGVRVEVRVTAADLRAPVLPSLTGLERGVLGAATAEPATAKRLAKLLGRRCDTHFYNVLKKLCDSSPRLLVKDHRGYRLPGPSED
jgi:hypothetical protein